MNSCNRGHIIGLEDGYSLYLLNERGFAPTPKARSFELPDDHVQYAPDRPADVKHVRLVIDLERTIANGPRRATIRFSPLRAARRGLAPALSDSLPTTASAPVP